MADPTRGDAERLKFVIDTQRLINTTGLDTEGIMKLIAERGQEITGADGAVVELAEDGEMVHHAVSGLAAGSLGGRLPMERSLSGLCARQNIPLICTDAEDDPRVDRDACRRLGVHSMAVVPLVHRSAPIGSLKVVSTQAGHFTNADCGVLELMAGFIAGSLSNSFTFEIEAHKALHDTLTGLPNRTLLRDRLTGALHKTRRHGGTFGVFYVNLDRFKTVNDSLGRDVGDAVLRTLARTLNRGLRSGDTLARLSGDEFVLVCDLADPSSESLIRDRLLAAVGEVRDDLSLEECGFGASIGVLWSSGAEPTAEDVLRGAETAMRSVKRRNRFLSAHS